MERAAPPIRTRWAVSRLEHMASICPHCGEPIQPRTLRLQSNYCPTCGKSRHSILKLNTLCRLRVIAYGAVGLAALRQFWNVPFALSVPLLLIPFSMIVWRFYTPVNEETLPRIPSDN